MRGSMVSVELLDETSISKSRNKILAAILRVGRGTCCERRSDQIHEVLTVRNG